MHVIDSIIQSTTMVRHDPLLNYWNPNLQIVTHKPIPMVHDQIKSGKKMPGLKTYLTQSKQESYNEPPTGAALLKTEYDL